MLPPGTGCRGSLGTTGLPSIPGAWVRSRGGPQCPAIPEVPSRAQGGQQSPRSRESLVQEGSPHPLPWSLSALHAHPCKTGPVGPVGAEETRRHPASGQVVSSGQISVR